MPDLLARLLALIFLAVAVLAGLVDATSVVAAGQFVLEADELKPWDLEQSRTARRSLKACLLNIFAPAWGSAGVQWVSGARTCCLCFLLFFRCCCYARKSYRRARPAGRLLR